MEKVKYFLSNRRKSVFIVLFFTIAIGSFLRLYNFSDWLHFELDQSRDATLISLAIDEGVGNLPLLGPRAAGSFLRLGPAFYYFEYLGAKFFGNTPQSLAYPVVFFSILSIPLLYLFLREYFSKKISLLLNFLFSVSLFVVMYSRFAWNPNLVPFFLLLTFFALLRLNHADNKRRVIWLYVFFGSLAIVTQMHFLAFVSVPAIAFLYLIIKRPQFRLFNWMIGLTIILIFYSPVIINDIKTGGDNAKSFVEVVTNKSGKDKHTLVEKIIRNTTEHSLAHFTIISGYDQGELFKFSNERGLDVSCGKKCRENLWAGIISLIIFIFGFCLLVKRFFSERDGGRKNFLLLILIWFAVTFILYVPFAYSLSPRFYLVSIAMPFIFLGLVVDFFSKMNFLNKYASVVIVFLFLFGGSNIWELKLRFSELSSAQTSSFEIKTDNIIKETNRITLSQQLAIAKYIQQIHNENGFPVFINSDSQYRRALLYHIERMGIWEDDLRNSEGKTYARANYFLVYPSTSNLEDKVGKYLNKYDIYEEKFFGTLTVFRLIPKTDKISAQEKIFKPKMKPRSASGVPVRCRWNEIFSKCNPEEELKNHPVLKKQ